MVEALGAADNDDDIWWWRWWWMIKMIDGNDNDDIDQPKLNDHGGRGINVIDDDDRDDD